MALFCDEFSDYLSELSIKPGKLLVAGDFNFHWDIENDSGRLRLYNILSPFGLRQHVKDATHTAGHILDLVCDTEVDNIISDTTVTSLISDHFGLISK